MVWWAYSSCISLTAPRVEGSNPRRSSSFSKSILEIEMQSNTSLADDSCRKEPLVYVKTRRHAQEEEEDWQTFESGMDMRKALAG